jgi:glutathione S-transferase
MKYKSRKGQLPFVELNGKEVADSDIIIRELGQYFEKDLDNGLSADQKNVSHAFLSMLNNHTSWVVRWWRYNNPGDFLQAAQLDIKRTLNSRWPNAFLNVIFKIGFKKNVKQAIGHGLGRHSDEEIYDFGKTDLKALSEFLADKEYFFGKEPHLLDCVAFAHLAQFIYIPFAGMKEWMEVETANLVALVDRIKNRYWSDWDEICSTLELNTHLPKKEISPDKEEEAKKEEAKKEDERKKKEERKRVQEEKKKEREEKKKREKEEKERKKKEREEKERERKEKEKAEKEKLEKENAEKEKAEKEEKEKAEADKKEELNDKKTEDEKVNSIENANANDNKAVQETKDSKTNEEAPAEESAEKKE